jgi:AcrR family transcriptional regulator
MQAALELIAERGFHGAPMAMIAEKAGVGAGTIYRYFETKDVLIRQLFEELKAELMAVLLADHPTGRPARERFFHLWKTLYRHVAANPLQFRYLEQYHNSPYGLAQHRDRLLNKPEEQDPIRDLFEEGVEQQILKDLPIMVMFSLAFGPLFGLIQDQLNGFIEMDDTLIEKTVAACWDALKR